MSHFSQRVHMTRSHLDKYARMKVDQGSTDWFLGREFRTYYEFIKTASWTTFWLKVGTVQDFHLLSQRVDIDSGAARFSVWLGATPSEGNWTAIPAYGRNRMSDTPVVVPSLGLSYGGTFTGGNEVDLLRLRTTASVGNQSAVNVGGDSDVRGLPAGIYAIKIEPITGVANTDALNGKIELLWAERPQGNVG